jgi:hypothetical protein
MAIRHAVTMIGRGRCAEVWTYFGRSAARLASVEKRRFVAENRFREMGDGPRFAKSTKRVCRTSSLALATLPGRASAGTDRCGSNCNRNVKWEITRRCLFAIGRMCQSVLSHTRKNCKTRQIQGCFVTSHEAWHASFGQNDADDRSLASNWPGSDHADQRRRDQCQCCSHSK